MELLQAFIYSVVVVGFFLGGKLSPLWAIKSYRTFCKSIAITKGEE
tara:strand:- start:259 stop:396 length:138 start_codon:yes stop_codon:yes gene_type:complete